MTSLSRPACLALAVVLCVSVSVAESADPPVEAAAQAQEGETKPVDPAAKPAEPGEKPQPSDYHEVTVVTASRTAQPLNKVPSAITVLSAAELEVAPADDFGDLLRNVPGVNVSQMSARDINITSRGSTNSLATSQLVLLDNRSLYLDFFGFVMWDLAPLDPKEIKQIEVVRGPGSAVWGANAMSGVVNMITKAPKEMVGTSLTLGGGEIGTLYGNVTHAGTQGNVGYKISAGYYEQDPYDRPTGTIPGTEGPFNPGGTPYPPFDNQGTAQPKLNMRVDIDQPSGATWSVTAGYAGTDGIIHSGIGPFDITSGTYLGFAKVDWTKNAMRASFFSNFLDGDADNLLTVGTNGQPLNFGFASETYNLDFSNTTALGGRHALTYGATVRRNNFDLTIAPQGDNRNEYGVFLQDEILFSEAVRWLIGARWDDIDPIGSVFSPRTSLMIEPWKGHTFRVSANRAFRAPSVINNYLDVTIFNQVAGIPTPLGALTLAFPVAAVGNPALQEEQLDAYEVGYVGQLAKQVTFTVSVYRNELTDSIDFFQADAYTAANAPPGFPLITAIDGVPISPVPLDPAFLANPPPLGLAGVFPLTYSYRNIGEIVDQGVELSLQFRPAENWAVYANYSWQDTPEVSGIPQETLPNGTTRDAVNTPPENRANLGVAWSNARYFANGDVNYQSDAFWTDVLDSRYWGPTDAFTMVNLSAGVNLGESVTLSVTAQNVFDERVLQHVFGDIISRKVAGQVILRF